MTDKPSVIRETDDEARVLARTLLRSARYVALAVLDPTTGFPFSSRVLLGTDADGVPAILVSGLSAHTKALSADPRSSLLAGEPGKGDPLAYARLTVQCLAETVERESETHTRLRSRFLRRHPKSKLYIDFPDFRFFRLVPQSANLNGGFGRAFILPGSDLIFDIQVATAVSNGEDELLKTIESLHPDIASRIASERFGDKTRKWRLVGIDTAGCDIGTTDHLKRVEFDQSASESDTLISNITKIAYPIP